MAPSTVADPLLTPDDVFRHALNWREITRQEALSAMGQRVVVVYRNGGAEYADWLDRDHPFGAGVGPHAVGGVRYFVQSRVVFRKSGGTVAPRPVDRTPTKAAPRSAAPSEDQKTWVEIELLDDKGRPVPGEPYTIVLPTGASVSGTLDQNGRARVDGIDPGTCQVSFPKIHQAEWKVA